MAGEEGGGGEGRPRGPKKKLQLLANGLCEIARGRRAPEIAGPVLALGDGVDDSGLDAVSLEKVSYIGELERARRTQPRRNKTL